MDSPSTPTVIEKELIESLIRESCDLKIERAQFLLRLHELERHHADELYWYRRFRELDAKGRK